MHMNSDNLTKIETALDELVSVTVVVSQSFADRIR